EEMWGRAARSGELCTPFEVVGVELAGANKLAYAGLKQLPLVVRNKVGDGAVITILVPRGLGIDERAHPVLPYLMNSLTAGLLPVEVRLPSGARPSGEVMYQVNRTKDGFLVALFNNRG